MKLNRRAEIVIDHASTLYHYVTQFHCARNDCARNVQGANDLIMAIDGIIMHCEQMKKEVEAELEEATN